MELWGAIVGPFSVLLLQGRPPGPATLGLAQAPFAELNFAPLPFFSKLLFI